MVLEELTLLMLTATIDCGKEFACHQALFEEHGLPLYFLILILHKSANDICSCLFSVNLTSSCLLLRTRTCMVK